MHMGPSGYAVHLHELRYPTVPAIDAHWTFTALIFVLIQFICVCSSFFPITLTYNQELQKSFVYKSP